MSLHITEREITVIYELLQGKSNPEIAKSLNISIITIKFYLGELFRKIGCRNRMQLLIYLFNNPQGIKLRKKVEKTAPKLLSSYFK